MVVMIIVIPVIPVVIIASLHEILAVFLKTPQAGIFAKLGVLDILSALAAVGLAITAGPAGRIPAARCGSQSAHPAGRFVSVVARPGVSVRSVVRSSCLVVRSVVPHPAGLFDPLFVCPDV